MMPAVAIDTTNTRILAAYEDHADDDLHAIGIIPNSSVTTTTFPTNGKGFIGIADIASTANATSKVRIGGTDTQQSGLTTAETYYAQSDGTLGTSADSKGSVIAGKALSSTKLLVNTS